MKKVLLATLVLSGFLFTNTINASIYDDQIISDIKSFVPDSQYDPDKDIISSIEELEVGKIQILPDNFLYFTINIKNAIKESFALNGYDRSNIISKTSSEKLKELLKCNELQDEKCIKNAIKNYKNYKKQLYLELSKLNKNEKERILRQISSLEINHYILLSNSQKNNNNQEIEEIIQDNFKNFGQFIKSITNNIGLKKSILESIDYDKKGKLKYISINNYLEKLSNYTNLEKRDVISQIIQENNVGLIKNINNIDIKTLEKTLQYYFYKTDIDNIFKQISIIDGLYKIQKDIKESQNKEEVKIAILNTKQIPISLFNQKISNLEDIKKSEQELESLFQGVEMEKINAIELLDKYNNGKRDITTYKLQEIRDANLLNLYKKISNINDSIQKEKLITEILQSLSPENASLGSEILSQIELNYSDDLNTRIIISRIRQKLKDNVEYSKETFICSLLYNPVCGENKVTYINECNAKKLEVKIAYKGECKILENDKLKTISDKELEIGWYYGNESQKKPGTPLSWINIDSESKNAKWIDPKKWIKLKGENK